MAKKRKKTPDVNPPSPYVLCAFPCTSLSSSVSLSLSPSTSLAISLVGSWEGEGPMHHSTCTLRDRRRDETEKKRHSLLEKTERVEDIWVRIGNGDSEKREERNVQVRRRKGVI